VLRAQSSGDAAPENPATRASDNSAGLAAFQNGDLVPRVDGCPSQNADRWQASVSVLQGVLKKGSSRSGSDASQSTNARRLIGKLLTEINLCLSDQPPFARLIRLFGQFIESNDSPYRISDF
jgi:hypothetical protein